MAKRLHILALIGVTSLIAACGQRTGLEYAADANPVPAAYGADASPEPEQLLELDVLADPERVVELRRRSEEREDDPFDLPPE